MVSRVPHTLLLLALLVAAMPVRASRPHVVLVIVDTLRADRLGCYGFAASDSSDLDALAAQGVRFERVIAQSSWTRPSIASLLTSRHPRALGIYDERDHVLDHDVVTLAEAFRAAGYTTYGATANPNINSSFQFDQGFARYLDSTMRFDWMEDESDSDPQTAPVLQPAREILASLVRAVTSGPGGPFYLQANLMEVHEARTEEEYTSAIGVVSREIGSFVRALTALSGWDDALFVVTSDHGQGLLDHPTLDRRGRNHGWHLYESQVVVPLILYSPGDALPRDTTVSRPVRLLDLMPTLLDLASLDPVEAAEGRSLAPLLATGRAYVGLPRFFVAETEFRETEVIGVYGAGWNYYEHRRELTGTERRELQRAGTHEDGRTTNRIEIRPDQAAPLWRHLRLWEGTHPRRPPARRAEPLSPEEVEQLEALGYLE